jgi:hypothetical protein
VVNDPDPVRPCTACARPTRPSRALIADYPGTAGRYGSRCITCYRNSVQEIIDPHAIENTMAGLERFLAARREREAAMSRREKVSV